MKRVVIVAAAAGLFVGLSLPYFGSRPEVQAQQEKAQKWEYKVVAFRGAESPKVIENETKKLNDLANDGWEYVGPVSNYSRTYGSGDVDSFGFVAFRRVKK